MKKENYNLKAAMLIMAVILYIGISVLTANAIGDIVVAGGDFDFLLKFHFVFVVVGGFSIAIYSSFETPVKKNYLEDNILLYDVGIIIQKNIIQTMLILCTLPLFTCMIKFIQAII